MNCSIAYFYVECSQLFGRHLVNYIHGFLQAADLVDDIREGFTQPLSNALNVLEIMVQQSEQMAPLLGSGKHSESRRKVMERRERREER